MFTGQDDAEVYRNRKGYFSVNVQVISSADLYIKDIVARWPGSAHDSTIFNNSRVKHRFDEGEFGNGFLLGKLVAKFVSKIHLYMYTNIIFR